MLLSAMLLFFQFISHSLWESASMGGYQPASTKVYLQVYSNNHLPFIVYIASEVKRTLKIHNQCYWTVTYGNLIPGIYYAYLVFTMNVNLGVFLALSMQAVDATQVPFIIEKLLSAFEDEFVFLAPVKFPPV